MHPIRKILVPTDFSEHSALALTYAADLAKRYNASVTLLHIYPVVNYAAAEGFALYTPEQLAKLITQLNTQLKASEEQARTQGVVDVGSSMLQGDAYQEILEQADDFDLVVMGTHGRTGLKHALMGSVAEKIVRTSPCPVLTVRSPSAT
jgi:nucleotide-binding universal stress UspA family protein